MALGPFRSGARAALCLVALTLAAATAGAAGAGDPALRRAHELRAPETVMRALEGFDIGDLYAGGMRGIRARRHVAFVTPRAEGGAGFTAVGRDSYGTHTIAVTDLDGDDALDLLQLAFLVRYAENGSDVVGRELRFTATRGSDGATLWTRPAFGIAGVLYVSSADVDGDGIADVVAFEDGYAPDHSTLAVRQPREFDQRISVVSGSDGGLLWERVDRGTVAMARAGTQYVEQVSNYVGLFTPLPVAAGEDPAFLITRQSWTVSRAGSVTRPDDNRSITIEAKRCDTLGDVVSGSTGALIRTIDPLNRSECLFYVPVGDRTGDGRPDLVLMSRHEIELRSGDGTERYWWRPILLDDDALFVAPAPLTSSDRLDVLVTGANSYSFGGGWFEFAFDHSVGFDGGTGATLHDRWARSFVTTAGSVDADGGVDRYDVLWDVEAGRRHYETFGGAGGATIWSREIIPPGSGASLLAHSDLDGNGGLDVLMRTPRASGGSETVAVDATTGDDLWRSVSGFAVSALGISGPAAGRDADGDGDADLYSVESESAGTYRLVVRDGMSLEPIWSATFESSSLRDLSVLGAYDLDGTPGGEAYLQHRVRLDDGSRYVLDEALTQAGRAWIADSRRFFGPQAAQ